MSKVISGTISELIAQGIALNGVKLGSAELSVLTRLGSKGPNPFVRKLGEAPRPEGKRGKPSNIYEFTTAGSVAFTQEPLTTAQVYAEAENAAVVNSD